jgi:hypothetical protein
MIDTSKNPVGDAAIVDVPGKRLHAGNASPVAVAPVVFTPFTSARMPLT